MARTSWWRPARPVDAEGVKVLVRHGQADAGDARAAAVEDVQDSLGSRTFDTGVMTRPADLLVDRGVEQGS
jgi:hypothetical protein